MLVVGGATGRKGTIPRLASFCWAWACTCSASSALFFGRLIKAAVSRQREFLADATAVQFTRNPDGIGGALKKIGGLAEGSRIENPHADEAATCSSANAFAGGHSPDCWPRTRRSSSGSAASTRLSTASSRRCRPVGNGREELEGPRPAPAASRRSPGCRGYRGCRRRGAGLRSSPTKRRPVGHVDSQEISYAHTLLEGMPDVLRVAAQEPFSARALVYALLLDPRADLRDLQLARLKAGAEPQDFAETLRLVAPVQTLPDTHRLPLLDLAMPALRRMSPRQYRAFRAQVEGLMIADQRLSLFEYTLTLCAATPSRRPVPAAAANSSSARLTAKTGAPGGDGVGAIGLGRPAGTRPGRPGFR